MSTASREKKKVTLQSTVLAVGLWVQQNREKLEGRTFNDIAGAIRKQFSGLVVADSAIRAALEHCNVNWKKTDRQLIGAGQDRVRSLARVVSNLIARLEATSGASLLFPQERELLKSLADGSAQPRPPLLEKSPAACEGSANGQFNGHAIESN